MTKWTIALALCAMTAPVFAQDAAPMPAAEREAYLEACLIVYQADPIVAAYQRVGTGAVTRGHATVALFDMAGGRSAQLECSFATLTDGPAPTAEKLVVSYAGGNVVELDLAAANAAISEQMK